MPPATAPCSQVFTASLQFFYSAFMTACCTPGILLIACRKGHCRGAPLPSIQTPPPMQIYECADSLILRHSFYSSQGSPAPGLQRYRCTEAESILRASVIVLVMPAHPRRSMSEITSKHSPLYASLPTIYDHHDQLWAGTPAHFLKHLYNNFDYRADDVWLSSYPRSGTAGPMRCSTPSSTRATLRRCSMPKARARS